MDGCQVCGCAWSFLVAAWSFLVAAWSYFRARRLPACCVRGRTPGAGTACAAPPPSPACAGPRSRREHVWGALDGAACLPGGAGARGCQAAAGVCGGVPSHCGDQGWVARLHACLPACLPALHVCMHVLKQGCLGSSASAASRARFPSLLGDLNGPGVLPRLAGCRHGRPRRPAPSGGAKKEAPARGGAGSGCGGRRGGRGACGSGRRRQPSPGPAPGMYPRARSRRRPGRHSRPHRDSSSSSSHARCGFGRPACQLGAAGGGATHRRTGSGRRAWQLTCGTAGSSHPGGPENRCVG